MILKFIFFLFLILVPFGLVALEKDYVDLVHEVSADFLRTTVKEKALYVEGLGGGMMDVVEEVFFALGSYRDDISLEEARILYIDLIEDYTRRLNEKRNLRPYLDNFPCDWRNIKLMLSFQSKVTGKHVDKTIAFISNSRKTGMIYYFTYDQESDDFIDYHEEHYEEALRIVKESRNSSPIR